MTSTELYEVSSSGRVPPQALDIERAVLGAMLLDREAVGRALEFINPETFYRLAHKQVFEALISLWEQNEAVDLLTVGEALQRNNQFDSVGGASYLAELLNSVATSANVAYHARLLKEKHVMRQIISRAKSLPKRVVYPEGMDETIIGAARMVADEGIGRPVLLGRRTAIKEKASEFDVSLEGIEVVFYAAEDKPWLALASVPPWGADELRLAPLAPEYIERLLKAGVITPTPAATY